jgi:hypothetical protein
MEDVMKDKKLDEYTVHLIVLIVFNGVLIVLERIFSESIERFFYALLPTLLLILLYILLHRRTTTFETSVMGLLETHIPDVIYVDDPETIQTEFIKAVNDAEKHIMTTGGKSKIEEYLSTIERNLEEKRIEYWRIISGEKISNELYEHVEKIIAKDAVFISYTTRELTPTLLLREKVAFLGLPDPKPDKFRKCLNIPDEKIIEHLATYIRIWYPKGEILSSKEDLERIKTLIK